MEKGSKLLADVIGSALRRESDLKLSILFLWRANVFGIGTLSALCLFLHDQGFPPVNLSIIIISISSARPT